MKKITIKPAFLTLALTVVSVAGVSHVFAQASIADVCGQTASASDACKLSDLKLVTRGIMTLVISIGLPLTFIFVAYRFVTAWFALQAGNANAYKEALQKTGNAILGFMFVVAMFGGLFFAVLKIFGVKPEILQILNLFSSAFVEHAHAQTNDVQKLNPVGVTNLYDFILSALRLVVRIFIYPALIAIWVWTGFSFVAAQGAPEALAKAKKWLMWAFITTLVIFMLQAFLVALRGTVQKILPGATTTQSK